MKRLCICGALAFLPTLQSSYAATTYTADFSAANVDDPANGVDGWVQSESDNSSTTPKTWIANVTPGLTKGIAIGGFYDVPSGDPLFDSQSSLDIPLLAGADFNIMVGVNDSVDYQYRNDFFITLLDSGGGMLATIAFTANSQNFSSPTQSDRSWDVSVNGAAPFCAVYDASSYKLAMNFTPNGSNSDFSLDVTSWDDSTTFTSSGTIAGGASKSIGQLQLGTTQGASAADWGDNIFGFTGIQVVPEPSVALLGLLSGFGLLRRKR